MVIVKFGCLCVCVMMMIIWLLIISLVQTFYYVQISFPMFFPVDALIRRVFRNAMTY